MYHIKYFESFSTLQSIESNRKVDESSKESSEIEEIEDNFLDLIQTEKISFHIRHFEVGSSRRPLDKKPGFRITIVFDRNKAENIKEKVDNILNKRILKKYKISYSNLSGLRGVNIGGPTLPFRNCVWNISLVRL
jgi:hypothetical protein